MREYRTERIYVVRRKHQDSKWDKFCKDIGKFIVVGFIALFVLASCNSMILDERRTMEHEQQQTTTISPPSIDGQ